MKIRRQYMGVILFLFAVLSALTACGSDGSPNVEQTAVPSLAATDAIPQTSDAVAIQPTTAVPDTPTAEPPSPIPPTPTSPPTIPPPAATDLSVSTSGLFLYPVPEIFAGDRVTFQILATVPEAVIPDEVPVHIFVDSVELANGTLGWRNLAGEAVGLFEWAWDTTDQIGTHTVQVILDPNDVIQIGDEDPTNNVAEVTAVVQDPALLLPAEANATWVTAETNCCTVHVVSNTAAYRDLSDLLTVVDTAFAQASERLEELPNRKYDVYLVDRVIGQGGYAGSAMVVSYSDRHYVSSGLHEVIVHEAVHLIDRQFAPQRIIFLAEGLAVWTSGGHYKQEDLDQRSAALVELGRYLPLPQLIDDFYPVQHEIGYLEAAGFVNYLVKTYGWSQFRAFYTDVTQEDAATLSEAMNVNLQTYFGITLAEAEADWLAYLDSLPPDRTAVTDLQTSLRFYDTMRRYQRTYDPTAYFLTAWLPYPQELTEAGNPADLTRHPETDINIALEVMLQAADTALREADYNRANVLLDSVDRVLDNNGVFIDPLAVQYLSIVQVAGTQGYEAQQVRVDGNHASIWATRGNTAVLTQLSMTLNGREWILSE